MSDIQDIKDNEFEEKVLKSELPVLVDFWAPWCPPCKSIAPVLEELAIEFDTKLQIVKINVDDNPLTPAKYNVRGIPNLMIFKGGEVVEQVVGALEKEQLVETINSSI